jgi:hypothetical protein
VLSLARSSLRAMGTARSGEALAPDKTTAAALLAADMPWPTEVRG